MVSGPGENTGENRHRVHGTVLVIVRPTAQCPQPVPVRECPFAALAPELCRPVPYRPVRPGGSRGTIWVIRSIHNRLATARTERMQIIGNGFLGTSLRPLADRHEDVVLFVSGVSSAGESSELAFAREGEYLHETLQRCRRQGTLLVYFSTTTISMHAFEEQDDRAGREDGPVYPAGLYGRHKLSMEAVITTSGADYLILRLATPVGPMQRSHQFLPSMIRQIRLGDVRVFHGARRDLIYVNDVMVIVDSLLGAEVRREVVNVASGVAVPVEDIISHLEDRLGHSARRHVSPTRSERPVSIDKLQTLVPAVATMGFGDTYYRDVIDRYLDRTTAMYGDIVDRVR
jgi:nucleoside-diphosphate-sugar epimerase